MGGKTVYQDAPCAGDGHKVDTTSAGPSNADVAAAAGAAAALCETALRTVPHWKDADSVRISDVKRMGFTTTKMHGTTLAVVRYGAMVEAIDPKVVDAPGREKKRGNGGGRPGH